MSLKKWLFNNAYSSSATVATSATHKICGLNVAEVAEVADINSSENHDMKLRLKKGMLAKDICYLTQLCNLGKYKH